MLFAFYGLLLLTLTVFSIVLIITKDSLASHEGFNPKINLGHETYAKYC